MGRLLILVALAGVVVWWLFGRAARLRGDRPPQRGAGRPDATPAAVDMVPCAHCGVHLPRSEAVVDGAELYCGEAHRRLGRRT